MHLWYSKKNGVNVGNLQHKITVLGLVLCPHDRELWAKSANIWLSGGQVVNMLPTFPAKTTPGVGDFPVVLGWDLVVQDGADGVGAFDALAIVGTGANALA